MRKGTFTTWTKKNAICGPIIIRSVIDVDFESGMGLVQAKGLAHLLITSPLMHASISGRSRCSVLSFANAVEGGIGFGTYLNGLMRWKDKRLLHHL